MEYRRNTKNEKKSLRGEKKGGGGLSVNALAVNTCFKLSSALDTNILSLRLSGKGFGLG